MPVFTVSQVTRYLRESLEQDPLLGAVWVRGEVSNLHPSQAGHRYFTIKDSGGQLRSVVFRNGKGADLLLDGRQIIAHGRITFYDARGDVQLIADLVMPEGSGPQHLELEKLKMQLEQEGLFDPSRKRALPRFPRVVGLVTSPSGAVFHDVQNVIARRYPLAEVLLAPTQVQGDGAARSIAAALRALNDDGRADVIILARGGGSLEELWPFNQEAVARAIHASGIPVVSAVGHETDFTIADYVADVRAPTPSAAAELVVPSATALLQEIRTRREGLGRAMSHLASTRRRDVETLARRLKSRAPDIDTLRRRVDDLSKLAATALSNRLSIDQERLSGLEMRLEALNPGAILHRGYAIVQKQPDREVVSQNDQVSPGEGLEVTVSDGSFGVTADGSPRRVRRARGPAVRAGAHLL